MEDVPGVGDVPILVVGVLDAVLVVPNRVGARATPRRVRNLPAGSMTSVRSLPAGSMTKCGVSDQT